MFPRKRRQLLSQALNTHKDHVKVHCEGSDDNGVGYVIIHCSCGDLVIYDRVSTVVDPFRASTYNYKDGGQ